MNAMPTVLLLEAGDRSDCELEAVVESAGFGICRFHEPHPAADGSMSGVTVVLADVCDDERPAGEMLSNLMQMDSLEGVPLVLLHKGGRSDDAHLGGGNYRPRFFLRKPVRNDVLISILRAAADGYRSTEELRSEVRRRTSAIGNIVSGTFEISTMDEARNLATMLSLACPSPDTVAIGMLELMVNAIEHGNLGIGFDEKAELLSQGRWLDEVLRRSALPEYSARVATVTFRRSPAEIEFTVHDQGDGFDAERVLENGWGDPLAAHGRGIFITRSTCFSNLHYEDGGRHAIAVLSLD